MYIICDELTKSDHHAFDNSDASLFIDMTKKHPLKTAEICETTKWSGQVCKKVNIIAMYDSCMGEPYFGYIRLKTDIDDFNISIECGIRIGVTFPHLMTPTLEKLFTRRNPNWKNIIL